MEKQQKKRLKKYIAWAALLCLVAVLTVLPAIAGKDAVDTGPKASILTSRAERRSISRWILGGGALTADTAVEITVPAAVKVKEYLVSSGDQVTEGQTIATVDRVSIMTAITQVQETLDDLAEELEDLRGDRESTEITASAGGTVKMVYGEEGEAVEDVLLRDGALAVLSLDGRMAVQIQGNTGLSVGDGVWVTLEDGTQVSGRVESNLEDILTVTVADEDFPLGGKVTVATGEGEPLGSGELYIHSPWDVVAYSGTISKVHVNTGDRVNAGTRLFTLKDTNHTAKFDSLSRQRREYEQLMLHLFQMYQSEAVTAPRDGMVTGVNPSGSFMLSGSQDGWQLDLLVNAPNGDDKTIYVNFVGQVAEVGMDGLLLKMNPQPLFITDYLDLSAVPMDTALMTVPAVYRGSVPVYAQENGEWVQLEEGVIQAGDILLLAGDAMGNFVWVVRLGVAAQPPEIPEETEPTQEPEPTEPAEPEQPTQPEEPTTPVIPGIPSLPGGGYPQISGRYPGMTQEAQPEDYSLDTVTIAQVIPQDTMTVSINVDELDISGIYPGQQVTLTVEALGTASYPGTVTAVSASGISGGGSSKFAVEITVEKIPDMLPGMTAHVTILLDTVENVISIPAAALAEHGGETIVYTRYDEKTEAFTDPLTVTVGVSDGEYVQILSGLEEGQTLCYPYYDTLVISNVPESGLVPFGG